jgi:hypothetical protein
MAAKHLRPRKRGERRTLSGQTRLWAIKETLRQHRRARTQGVAALRDDIKHHCRAVCGDAASCIDWRGNAWSFPRCTRGRITTLA